ncbi:MAG: Fis family transcriptional regulator [Cellvibrionaceae bacterium]|nr:Fis family transcriptional regulator [Cellvibrionaceae bacterium]|tara:strand:+ start:5303 stop:5695 length:393 start_codon:yes stop_codon:yes gene_type:complete
MSQPKSKTQKKIDNNIRVALTAVCEKTLGEVAGFEWLTHQANYTNFPASLLITCVFSTDKALTLAHQEEHTFRLQKTIQSSLLKVGVKFKSLPRQVVFDSEEACAREDEGDWAQRLARLEGRSVLKNRPS